MSTIQINPNTIIGTDSILKGVSSLDTPALEEFFQQIAQLIASRKSPNLSSRETELLSKINEGYPSDLNQKYELLSEKNKKNMLNETEQTELFALTDYFEVLDAQRLERLIELAQIQHISLDKLIKKMGLSAKPDSNV
jgi:intergrase/recombinase